MNKTEQPSTLKETAERLRDDVLIWAEQNSTGDPEFYNDEELLDICQKALFSAATQPNAATETALRDALTAIVASQEYSADSKKWECRTVPSAHVLDQARAALALPQQPAKPVSGEDFPATIWLDGLTHDSEDRTWCEDNVYDNGMQYIRADRLMNANAGGRQVPEEPTEAMINATGYETCEPPFARETVITIWKKMRQAWLG